MKLHFSLRLRCPRPFAELAGWVTHGDLAERLEELRALVPAVADAAAAAREGGLTRPQVEAVSAALSRLEAALRRARCYAAE